LSQMTHLTAEGGFKYWHHEQLIAPACSGAGRARPPSPRPTPAFLGDMSLEGGWRPSDFFSSTLTGMDKLGRCCSLPLPLGPPPKDPSVFMLWASLPASLSASAWPESNSASRG